VCAAAARERETIPVEEGPSVLPRTSHPWVSAGLGATEPLCGSTIRGLSDAQRERRVETRARARRTERTEATKLNATRAPG